MACSLCPSVVRKEEDDESSRKKRQDNLWFGDGLYWWPQSFEAEGDLWVFGLEDKYFPVAKSDSVELISSAGSHTESCEGLTEGFLNFLERRLNLVGTVAAGEISTKSDGPVTDVNSVPNETVPTPVHDKPIPPIRQRRLKRSVSLQPMSSREANEVRSACLRNSYPLAEYPATSASTPSSGTSRLKGRRGSVAADWMKTVKGWATVTTTIRKAIRRVCGNAPVSLPIVPGRLLCLTDDSRGQRFSFHSNFVSLQRRRQGWIKVLHRSRLFLRPVAARDAQRHGTNFERQGSQGNGRFSFCKMLVFGGQEVCAVKTVIKPSRSAALAARKVGGKKKSRIVTL